MRVIVRKTHCRYCDDEFSTITVYPFALCVNGQTVISRNNVFMLTAPENYGIVPVAEKIPVTEKTDCSGQGNEGIQLQLNHCVSAFDA